MYTFPELTQIIHGKILQQVQQYPLRHLLTDSRKVANPEASLFFAITSNRNNGHRYIPELYRKGVRQFVIQTLDAIPGVKDIEEFQHAYPLANFVLVANTLEALQKLAANHRQKFQIPVYGITGSNGKTIVKEWLAQLLSPDERIVKSPRSYNSQIGVPLSVWEMQLEHTVGIFEAGISKPGEMEKLRQIIQPTYGIFTNIGTAHDEGFESKEQKTEEKLCLFKNVEKLFYCKDHTLIHALVKKHGISSFTWSHTQTADLLITSVTPANGKAIVTYTYQQKQNSIQFPFSDDASIENAIHCLAVLLYRGLNQDEIQQRMEKLHPVAMRLEMKEAINGCYLIDDSYNNDLAGLRLALDLLQQQPRAGKKTLILSDLLEQGQDEDALYSYVAQLVSQRHVDRLIGIGPVISRFQLEFGVNSAFYPSTESFLDHFQENQFKNEVILVKGARVFGFERIVQVFQQKVHGTVLEVNLDALVHNLNFYRSKLKPGIKLMVMVKAFAYGSGSYEIANLLQFHRVDYLAVAYVDEGVALREHGITLPIMVMNPSPDSFAKLRQYHLEPEIYSLELLTSFLNSLPASAQNIHLKLDTGMHRLGFTESEFPLLFEKLQQNPQVKVVSVFSHLAGADEACHNDFSGQQIRLFNQMAQKVEKVLGYTTTKHILNSAGIVRFPDEQQDMVRLGIGLYGVEATGNQQDALRIVSSLKTTVSQVKHIQKGDTIGYSRKGIAEKDTIIATIAIGYADGYDRRFSNGVGQVVIHGKKAPVIGNVCMDMSMIDVTEIGNVKAGDDVFIFGEQFTLKALAASIGTISYELLTNVSARVKRVFYSE